MEAGRTQINAVQLGTLAKFYCISIHYFYENDHGLKGVRTLEREGWLADQLLRHNELLDKYRSRIEDLEVMVSMRNGNANEEQCVNQITPFFAKHVL